MPRLYIYTQKKCKCLVCENIFNKDEIIEHLKTNHVNECYNCKYCKELIADEAEFSKHNICRKSNNT